MSNHQGSEDLKIAAVLGGKSGLHQEDHFLTHGAFVDLRSALNEGRKIVVESY